MSRACILCMSFPQSGTLLEASRLDSFYMCVADFKLCGTRRHDGLSCTCTLVPTSNNRWHLMDPWLLLKCQATKEMLRSLGDLVRVATII